MKESNIIGQVEDTGVLACLAMHIDWEFVVTPTPLRDERGQFYVEVMGHRNNQWQSWYRHYPAELLSPEDYKWLVDKGALLTKACDFLEGSPCLSL